MARTVTLAQLIEDTRRWANIRTSTPDDAHLTDTDIARLVELRMAELHEMLNSASASAFSETTASVAIVSGSGALPDDFYSLVRAWVEWSSTDHESLGNIEAPQDATIYQGITWSQGAPKAFRIVGATLKLFPPAVSATVKIAYIPAFANADEYDTINGWEKMVTMGAALDALLTEGRTNSALEARYAEQADRVRALIEERQGQDAPKIRDVTGSVCRSWWGSGTGGP